MFLVLVQGFSLITIGILRTVGVVKLAILVTFQAVSSTLTKGVLRTGGDTKFLMVADVLFLWLVSIPLGGAAGLVLNLSPGIVFFFLKIDEVIKALWCSKRLFKGKWIKHVTEI